MPEFFEWFFKLLYRLQKDICEVIEFIQSIFFKVGGIEDLRSKQGFYIYRNKRLIIWGTWFGMKQRAELTKNARIRVDIPNSLDDIWWYCFVLIDSILH